MADLERQPQQPAADDGTLTSSEQVEPTVDKTSISPVGPDKIRKNSLENHLMHRPDRAELVESL